MNPEEQTVTWLISLGVLSSPKKNIADPEEFLKTSLKDGVVLCKLTERLIPGFTPKYSQDPRTEADCITNIREFLRGCSSLKVEGFEPEWLYTGENFGKVLTTLLAVNFATQGKSFAVSLQSQTTSSHTLSSVKSKGSLRRQSKSVEMSENGGGGQVMVKARFNFKQNNEDELSFNKGDLIHVLRQEEGGWWEGTLNGKTGWFPSNYVREIKPCEKPLSPKGTPLTKNYYSVVTVLSPLMLNVCIFRLSSADSATLCGNLEEILTFQQALCVALEDCTKVPEGQQRVAGCYLNLMFQIKTLYLAYCSSHPSAVSILTDHSEELDKFMESQGASAPGILTLTTSLSKPFMRLDKYPTLLQELERHVEEAHPDYADIVKATAAFRSLVTQCQELRKRKNLELQILSEPVRGWDGDSMKSLGHVAYMSQVHVKNGSSEEKEERYLMLFPNVLVMLSASPRMSGFIYQVRYIVYNESATSVLHESFFNFMIDRITVFCSSAQELQDWLEHLHMVGPPTHLSHLGSLSAVSRGPLEPPKISKPWSLSCLRPAPPLKPSAALGYKEDSSKSPRPMKKFLPGNRKKERKPSDDEVQTRKSTVALEEDAQILRVIEAYCTGIAHLQQMIHNGQTVIEEKSLVDAVYALKDEVHELKKENKWMKQFLEEEQKSRKDLERVVRKLAKQKNDSAWDDGGH
uniref:Rac/Cdc42 guanine nucleotide exchange factor 6 n=1 Tax=Sander lucioperca TaxID=283035 RepID=A0A8D0AEL7_SANLU